MKSKKSLVIRNLSLFILSIVLLQAGCGKDKLKIVKSDPIMDIDGNYYGTIVIGDQTWMAENLKTTKYNDGTTIPYITDKNDWKALSGGAYCWYDNIQVNGDIYGNLYNWHAVNTNKLCPTGWHVPSYNEWTTLIDFLEGEDKAGYHLKEAGAEHWGFKNTGKNSVGFNALPGGQRYGADGDFGFINIFGTWWTSSLCSSESAWSLHIQDSFEAAYLQQSTYILCGFSVRCIED